VPFLAHGLCTPNFGSNMCEGDTLTHDQIWKVTFNHKAERDVSGFIHLH